MNIRTVSKTRGGIDPMLFVDSAEHKEYVDYIRLTRDADFATSQSIWKAANDWWELFLAHQEDTRDPVDEQWRSDIFVPLPFSTTRTKAAALTEVLGNTEPIWQVEATREEGNWYEQAAHYQRLLDYTCRANSWRRLLYKTATSRSVAGTQFIKAVWGRRAHTTFIANDPGEVLLFQERIGEIIQKGAPQNPDPVEDPAGFRKWRDLINTAGTYGRCPAFPIDGEQEVIEYEGPIFQAIPIWSVYLNPLIDEMIDQKVINHRMVKPLKYVLDRADDDPDSEKPYYLPNVLAAEAGWDGKVLQDEEQELARGMGLEPNERAHPYFRKACELEEVWSPEEPFQYSLIMNRRWVINKRPMERPLLTSIPNIFALRNIIVPGHFYGMSDYQEPEKLFKELNQFRRLRMDGATLTTLPAFVKQQGLQLSEGLRKLRPGAIYTAPTANGIQSLIKHTLAPEAYREPQEIKLEIEDATEVYSSTKGAPASVGRVTGVEFQGRSNQVTLKQKIDASLFEEELEGLPRTLLAMWAQYGKSRNRLTIGGDPDAVVDVSRADLIENLGMRFRFRGATKNIQPDLLVQQITKAVNDAKDVLTTSERRATLQLILETLDIRGLSKILTMQGQQQMDVMSQAQMGAQTQDAAAQKNQSQVAGVAAPASVDASTMEGQ